MALGRSSILTRRCRAQDLRSLGSGSTFCAVGGSPRYFLNTKNGATGVSPVRSRNCLRVLGVRVALGRYHISERTWCLELILVLFREKATIYRVGFIVEKLCQLRVLAHVLKDVLGVEIIEIFI